MALTTFDFEKPIVDLELETEKLRDTLRKKQAEAEERASAELSTAVGANPPSPAPESIDPGLEGRILEMEGRLLEKRREIYGALNPWQRIQIARHPARPHALDYIQPLIADFVELRGDRHYGDDKSIVAGLGRLNDRPVAIVGQQKGSDLKDNLYRNFGMMHPEGYRKAMRVMKLAEKFELPIIILIDTPGAYPGIGAEERGQGEAIGRNIMEMFMLRVPIVCAVIGEGASGGALGIGVGDRLLMLKYAWYCVISPEGCATILYRDSSKASEAAQSLRLTAEDLLDLHVIDEIVPEPLGGAHRDPLAAAEFLREGIARHLGELERLTPDELLDRRFEKYRRMGETALVQASGATP